MNTNRAQSANKKLLVIGIVVGLFFNMAWQAQAVPPSAIELSYDEDKKTLHVAVKHVSKNTHKDYIRKLNVYQNDKGPTSYYFPAQTSATELITDIPLDVNPKDVIRVEAVCSNAGRGEQTLVIAE